MRICRRALQSLCLLATALVTAPATAQDYPARPIRIITDAGAGSAIDVVLRIFGERLTHLHGQPVVIVNQPGGGGAIAARAAAQSAPDGYTLFVAPLSTFVTTTGTASNLPIRVPRDFLPVAYLGGAPMMVAGASWLEVKTLPELIALAKKKPGDLTYGTNGRGRLTHLTGALLASRADIELLMIPYSGGTAQVLADMMGKRVPLVIDGLSAFTGALQAGSVFPLAIASRQRLPNFPDVQTVAETLPGFAASGWQVVLAPVGTPDTVVQKANADWLNILNDPETRKRIAHFNRDEQFLSPAETTAFIQSEQAKWEPVLKQVEAAGAK
jgi:tripartite-type tricarboxylate transporter receptor subunit TctC